MRDESVKEERDRYEESLGNREERDITTTVDHLSAQHSHIF